MAVMVFIVVVMLAGAAFFAVASYETRGATYRQASSEAFYLADGALERARARFLSDRTWRDGWQNEPVGRGSYDLEVADTTLVGQGAAVQLIATGRVGPAVRRITALVTLPPTSLEHALHVVGSLLVQGNFCLRGRAQINGTADFGSHDSHLHCGGTYRAGVGILPPGVYTEAEHYRGATYYEVRAWQQSGTVEARVFDAQGADLTTALGDSLTGVVSYVGKTQTYIYAFDSASRIEHYFDDATGIFRPAAGDTAVVVNFGEPPLGNPTAVCDVVLESKGGGGTKGKGKGGGGSAATVIRATIINSRFVGVTDADRLDATAWEGGAVSVKQIVFEPTLGVAVIAHDYGQPGSSQVTMGTDGRPALVYVTRDVTELNANYVQAGSVICLGDWDSRGGPDLIYDPDYMTRLPEYFFADEVSGTSGTLKILDWREVASSGP